jgi:phosphatidylserine/phosphatidylglycerophosphate/cardiolipin synthase-like enzyme
MHADTFFRPGENCWKVVRAERATLLIDGEDYFRAVRSAILKAKKRVVMLSWDVDTRVEMHDTQGEVTGPLALGEFIDWVVKRNPDLRVYILRWDIGSLKTLGRGLTFWTLLRWMFHPRIHLKLDSHHPALASVHRKIISIDEDTAFCGGIDVTERRWDTREHLPHNPHRAPPGGEDDGPWHDASMIVQGPIARELAAYGQDRWENAGGRRMRPPHPTSHCWPDHLEPTFQDVDIAIARTEPQMDDQEEVREIERLFLDMIASARRWIYAESQYFASKAIAEAIEQRLSQADCPEIVLLNPVTADGPLEAAIMQPQRAVLLEKLNQHPNADRFRVYHPITSEGGEIYCHAKIMIIDDDMLRIGSANLNNRSMGFDSECDLALHAGSDPALQQRFAAIRADLLSEHLSHPAEAIAARLEETGSLFDVIEHFSARAREAGHNSVRPYRFPDQNGIERMIGESDLMDPESNAD